MFGDGALILAALAALVVALASGSFIAALAAGAAMAAAALGWQQRWWQRGAALLWPQLQALGRLVLALVSPAARPKAPGQYDLLLGKDVDTNRQMIENLANLGHAGVYGQSQYGKTTLLHSWINWLISHHSPDELLICISDPKTVDYTIYDALPHLFCPRAIDTSETGKMLEALVAEKARREALFRPHGKNHICNNITRYYELSGQRLPRIVAIFDEVADVIEPGSKEDKIATHLVKTALAFGIQLIFATQRPSSGVMSGDLKSQFNTRLSTWMPSAKEYGVVAELPKTMYASMPRIRGRFMIYTGEGWRFMQSYKVADKRLEETARRLRRGRVRTWQDVAAKPASSATSTWNELDEERKVAAMREFIAAADGRPSLAELVAYFDISRPTAVKYRRLAEE